jgi:AcrR family transcriptional regulator
MARRPLKREDRRESVLRAAATAFARAGFDATSMSDVADEAGVSKVIVYRHVPSKAELYQRVLQRVSDRLWEVWSEEVAHGERGMAARTHLSVARENPDGYRLLWSHAVREPSFAPYAHRLRAAAEDVADEAIGERVDPRLRRWAVVTYVDTLVDAVLRWLELGDEAEDELFIERTTAGLEGLRRGWGHEGRPLDAVPSAQAADGAGAR